MSAHTLDRKNKKNEGQVYHYTQPPKLESPQQFK